MFVRSFTAILTSFVAAVGVESTGQLCCGAEFDIRPEITEEAGFMSPPPGGDQAFNFGELSCRPSFLSSHCPSVNKKHESEMKVAMRMSVILMMSGCNCATQRPPPDRINSPLS